MFDPIKRRALRLAAAALVAAFAAPAFAQTPPAKDAFRVGFQKGAYLLSLLKIKGTLEKSLADANVDVRWIEFPAGPQMLEALNVGSIDFGYVGEAPPIFAQAAGAAFVYVGYESASPAAEAILVPKGSPIKTVAELKGKKVALNKGSNVHYLLVKLLEKSGLAYRDVEVVFLAPADARAAFERGAIDAWAIWDPFKAAAERQIDARRLADGTGVVNNYLFFLAAKDFAARRPAVIRTLFDVAAGESKWAAGNYREAAALLAPLQGLEPSIIELSLRRYRLDVNPITDQVLGEQQKVADTFAELKLIPRRINVRDAAPGAKN